MTVKEVKKKILQAIGNLLIGFLIDVLCKTLKISSENSEDVADLLKNNKNFIAAFWHGNMIVPWYIFRNKKFSSLVSKSKDGELLNKLLTKWKFDVIRGSSRDGGKLAMEQMLNVINNGRSLAITPDGPTGPYREMKPGAVIAAKKCEVPIILIGVNIKNKKCLKSWDKFEVPKPFSKVLVKFSDAIYINKDLNYDETNTLIKMYSDELNKIQTEVESIC